jgi:hypothetical protein
MNKYVELKKKQEEEFNNFPCFFAFNRDQLKKGMEKLNLTIKDTDKIYKGCGGMFYKKTDSQRLHDLFSKHATEMKESIKKDDGYIFDMFDFELSNHEYCYTADITDTLAALGLTENEITKNQALSAGLKQAIKNQWREDE